MDIVEIDDAQYQTLSANNQEITLLNGLTGLLIQGILFCSTGNKTAYLAAVDQPIPATLNTSTA